jgi:hypothetical protein
LQAYVRNRNQEVADGITAWLAQHSKKQRTAETPSRKSTRQSTKSKHNALSITKAHAKHPTPQELRLEISKLEIIWFNAGASPSRPNAAESSSSHCTHTLISALFANGRTATLSWGGDGLLFDYYMVLHSFEVTPRPASATLFLLLL